MRKHASHQKILVIKLIALNYGESTYSIHFLLGCLNSTIATTIKTTCPDTEVKVLKKYAPFGQKAAGDYTEVKNITNMDDCAKSCCLDASCHYAFTVNTTCYSVKF